jgi:hypothetical protein
MNRIKNRIKNRILFYFTIYYNFATNIISAVCPSIVLLLDPPYISVGIHGQWRSLSIISLVSCSQWCMGCVSLFITYMVRCEKAVKKSDSILYHDVLLYRVVESTSNEWMNESKQKENIIHCFPDWFDSFARYWNSQSVALLTTKLGLQ